MPHTLSVVARVPAVQVAIRAEGVQISGRGVETRTRRWPGIQSFVTIAVPPVARAVVRLLPDLATSECVYAVDMVLTCFPAHCVQAILDDDRPTAAGIDVDTPRCIGRRPRAAGEV